jgi:protein-glutamine gamma-glutamyltransferase
MKTKPPNSIRVRWNLHTISLSGIVLAMGYAGAVQNNGAAYLLCFITAVLAAMSWLRARENLRGLVVTAGRMASAQAGAVGKLPLEIRATAGESACGLEVLVVGGGGRWSFVEQIESGSSVRLSLPIQMPEAGVQESVHVRIRSNYPLGLFSAEREVEIVGTRRIHPRPQGALPLPSPDRALSAESVSVTHAGGRPGSEGDDFAGMREWQMGDSLRHVDWRAVARGRPLLVKQWAAGAGSAVALDWDQIDLPEPERAGQMARWIEQCEASGTPYALRLPEVVIKVNLGVAHAQQCLDALAERSASTAAQTRETQMKAKRLPPGHEHSAHLPRGPLLGMSGMLALVAVPLLDFASVYTLMLLAGCIAWRLLLRRPLALWVPVLVLSLGALMIQLMQGSVFSMTGGIAVLIVLLGAKLLESRTPHDFQVLGMVGWFLCLCGLLSEQTLSRSLWALGVFAGIAVCMVRFRRGSLGFQPALRLTGSMLAQALPVAVALFFIFPRGSLEFLSRFGTHRGHKTGISGSMAPGLISNIAKSDEVAFRAEFPDTDPPPNGNRYWRCVVLWECAGLSWERGWADAEGPSREREKQPGDMRQLIALEPHGQQWLPCLDVPVSATVEGRMIRPEMNDLLMSDEPVNSLYRIEVISRLTQDRSEITDSQRRAALRLPEDLSPRVRDLALQFKKGAKNDVQIAQAAVELLRKQRFQYTLEPGTYVGPGALDEFLFERRIGFCEHFSAAFATLMRAAGVPSRVVIGYIGGEWTARGGYMIVKQSDAHAWTELWLESTGWTRVDPTAALVPARMDLDLRTLLLGGEEELERQRKSLWWQSAQSLRLWWDSVEYDWYKTVIGFDEESQIAWLTWLGLGRVRGRVLLLVSIVFLGLTLLALALWLRRPARHRDPWARAWQRLCRKLERLGAPTRAANEGPLSYAERAAVARPALADEIRRLAGIYALGRYGEGAGRLEFERAIRKLR